MAGGQIQHGGVAGQFVGVVEQPGDLVALTAGIVGVSFHFFVFCFWFTDRRSRVHIAGVAGIPIGNSDG